MSYSATDLETIAKKIRYDLTAAQGKLTDLMNGIAELGTKLQADDHGYLCPDAHCRLRFSTAAQVVDHQRNVHGEDLPIPKTEAA